ncbi:Pvc16 family protein [Mycolicibacterium iranicum]|uniref:Pvc16 N-terminal domain-containing protein n=1 Tax=Mycolicibacterium iranicum TaxID=912594 RepID=A0A178LS20_MYCIR|nr:Pvc16 family protein [Mycolicibacterium iranicum]OAN36777.1 hypothetical protein A4X20_06165 [Mycolicibacterium iranicum]
MALSDTGRAIGAVTRLLQSRLLAALSGLAAPDIPVGDVTVSRPEPSVGGDPARKLNLFLYEVQLDGGLRSVALDEGQPPPIWLVLRYLMTAFDRDGESDTIEAHEILGEGMRVLQDLNFFSLDGLPAATVAALADNPEQLKLTFDDATSDLLSKLMNGSDEKYRCSVAFQVRPVPVAMGTPPSYSLLVGVDYTRNVVIGEDGVRVPVLPSIGPRIDSLTEPSFQIGDSVAVSGDDLHLSDLSVLLGPVELGATSQRPDRLTFEVDSSLADGARISAGSHAVVVAQSLPSGRRRKSNPVVGNLRPRLDNTALANLTRVVPADPASPVYGRLTLTGVLLGTEDDDVFVALYRNGRVIRLFDDVTRAGVTPQTELRVEMAEADAVVPGAYMTVLRVNGVQAKDASLVNLVAP